MSSNKIMNNNPPQLHEIILMQRKRSKIGVLYNQSTGEILLKNVDKCKFNGAVVYAVYNNFKNYAFIDKATGKILCTGINYGATTTAPTNEFDYFDKNLYSKNDDIYLTAFFKIKPSTFKDLTYQQDIENLVRIIRLVLDNYLRNWQTCSPVYSPECGFAVYQTFSSFSDCKQYVDKIYNLVLNHLAINQFTTQSRSNTTFVSGT